MHRVCEAGKWLWWGSLCWAVLGLGRLAAALDVHSDIVADTTWTAADSPVWVHLDPFVVDTNATLTIEPGVSVHFTNAFVGGFKVYGQLRAMGSPAQRIKFESWGPGVYMPSLNLQLRGNEPMKTNELHHVDMTNMNTYVYFWGRVATLTDCHIATRGNFNWAVRGYCNLGTTPGAKVRLLTNSIVVVSTYSSTGSSDYGGLQMDGYPVDLLDNQLSVTPVGELSHFVAVKFDVSNTTAFDALVAGNTITADADLATNNLDATGIRCDTSVRCTISNCTLALQGRGHLTGILKTDTNQVVGNTITLTTTNTATFANLHGVDFQSASAGHNDLLINNRLTINSGSDQQYIYGFYVESGRVANNRVVVNQHGADSYVYGLSQVYYGGSLENNTIILNTTNGNRNIGIFLGDHFNPAHEIRLFNNLVAQQILLPSNAAAIYQDAACGAVVTNSHNLTYNFISNFVGCAPGPGTLTNDPCFADAAYRPATNSPAIDSGTNQDWMAMAVDLDGHPRIINQVVDRGAFEWTEPSLVTLAGFRLREESGRLLVCWETAAEYETIGFHVYRWIPAAAGGDAGSWLPVSASLVPARGWPQGGRGAAYCVADHTAQPGSAYQYKLVEIETSGDSVEHGPFVCRATMSATTGLAAADGHPVVQWTSRLGESYRVWKAVDLRADFAPVSPLAPATPPLNCFTDQAHGAGGFYRIETIANW